MCTLKLRRQRNRSCKRQEGQIVKSRDVLFVIDPRPYQEVLDQAKANLQTTDAQRRLQDADFARATRLFGRLVAIMPSYRWLRRERDTSETIPISNVTTLIFGRMSFTSSISPARLTFKAIYSTTIAPTSRPILSGKPGCARNNRVCWSFGASMKLHLIHQSLSPIVATCQMLRYTLSPAATLLSMWLRMRLRRSSGAS